MNDELDPMLDGPDNLVDQPAHRTDRTYAVALAVTVVAVLILVTLALWTAIHGQNRAEDSADRNAEIAQLLRGQLAVALEEAAVDEREARCRGALAVKVDVAVLDNAIAFDNLLLSLSADGTDLTAIRAEVAAARDAMAAVKNERQATDQTCTERP
jgi:hypothetical protein